MTFSTERWAAFVGGLGDEGGEVSAAADRAGDRSCLGFDLSDRNAFNWADGV